MKNLYDKNYTQSQSGYQLHVSSGRNDKHGEISGHDLFIDGTKIESCANRYTFVWKKAVTKSLAKKDISRTENMSYDPEKNLYICAEGKELSFDQIKM